MYRMVMNDCGTFAVKRIDRSREGSDQVFERELEILGSIKHINLVNLRGYCRLPTARLLIYDYLVMGSLDNFLHGMFPLLKLIQDIKYGKCVYFCRTFFIWFGLNITINFSHQLLNWRGGGKHSFKQSAFLGYSLHAPLLYFCRTCG